MAGWKRLDFLCRDPESLARFYVEALGFRVVETAGHTSAAQGITPTLTLRLGDEVIMLRQCLPSARPHPEQAPGWSPLFQHIAIVVSDITTAYANLCNLEGWTAISTDGPERLPTASGGVSAFKFRDPDGHPLELLAYPQDEMPQNWAAKRRDALHLGIDHTAISVTNTALSLAFYEALGFEQTGGSHNIGDEQARLDGIEVADVEVTSLAIPYARPPHLELLCYRGAFQGGAHSIDQVDIASTQTVIAADPFASIAKTSDMRQEPIINSSHTDGFVVLSDPNGHLIRIELSVM